MDMRFLQAQARRQLLEPEFIQKWELLEASAFGAVHVANLEAPCPEGSTVVLHLIDDPFSRYYTCTDDEGNTYTQVYNDSNTSYDKRGVYFVCAGVTGTPQQITLNTWLADLTTPANTSIRSYISNWWRLSATVDGFLKTESSAATTSATSITTTVANCVMFLGVSTSPSRTPSVVSPSTLFRMNYSGGAPYTGALSQHTAFRQCGAPGAHSVETTWVPEGNAAVRTFGIALRPMT